MSSVSSQISSVISKTLLKSLPSEFASKFNLDEDEVKEFFQEQLKKEFNTTKTSKEKTSKGKGRVTGYIVYSSEMRKTLKEKTPDISFIEIGKKLGESWKKLSEKDQSVWTEKARVLNESNGLSVAKSKGKTMAKKQSVVEEDEE